MTLSFREAVPMVLDRQSVVESLCSPESQEAQSRLMTGITPWEFWCSVKATVADLKKSICEKFPELVPQERRQAVALNWGCFAVIQQADPARRGCSRPQVLK